MDEYQESGDSANKVFEYSLAPCDKVATLYVMQQKMDSPIYNIPEWVIRQRHPIIHFQFKCIFFFYCLFVWFRLRFSWLHFSRIKLSNLLLVVVRHEIHAYPSMGAEAKQINYTFMGNHTFPCHKKNLNKLERRRLDDCFTEDCRVSNMFANVWTIPLELSAFVFLCLFHCRSMKWMCAPTVVHSTKFTNIIQYLLHPCFWLRLHWFSKIEIRW